MGRPALRVRVEAAVLEVTLLCCHLKSKLLTYPGGRFNPRDEDQRARYVASALTGPTRTTALGCGISPR